MRISSSRRKANPNTCEFCPHKYDEGCPCWITEKAGFTSKNIVTGEERFVTGCFYQVIPWLMVEVVKASNRPAAAVEDIRNQIVEGFQHVTGALMLHAPRKSLEITDASSRD